MKISKNVKLYAIVWAILLILFNVIVFVTPSEINGESKFTQTFWLGYALTTLGFIAQLVCTFISLNGDNLNKIFFNLPLLRVSFIGLVISAVAGSVFMAIPTAEAWISAIVCLVVTAFVAIACIKAKSAGDIASSVEKKIKEQTFFIKNLTVDAQSLLSRASTPEIRETANKVYEAVRYSDPMSNDALADIEGRISYEFKTFEMAVKSGDNAVAQNQAQELLALIDSRNNKCKALK